MPSNNLIKNTMLETGYYMATKTYTMLGEWKSYDAFKKLSRYSSARWAAGEDHGRIYGIWYLLAKGKWVNMVDSRR